MKQLLTVALIATIFSVSLKTNATIRRVGYFGTATAIDYSDLQSAHDASNPGDSIYLYQGNWSVNLSKKLNIFGYGYFLAGSGANNGLQVMTAALNLYVYFNAGSDSSVIDGVGSVLLDLGPMNGAASTAVIVKHCNITTSYTDRTYLTNWQIRQCYISAYFYLAGFSNLQISNCVIVGGGQLTGGGAGSTGQFSNCIFSGYPSNSAYNASIIFKNCIDNSGYMQYQANNGIFPNSLFVNCILNTDGFPVYTSVPGSNNQIFSFGTTPVFVSSGSNDGQFTLISGSPAKGAGVSGTDCGIFGGLNPYVLSGLPAMPAFYQLTSSSPLTSGNPYTITFSVQSH